ncbi:MAG: enoyl-CoA hydratase [bacterium]
MSASSQSAPAHSHAVRAGESVGAKQSTHAKQSINNNPSQVEPVLLRAHVDGVETLTLNRPAQYNALSEALLGALSDALDQVGKDSSVRVVVLAANGKAFCAGHDLKQMREHDDRAYQHALFSQCSAIMSKLTRLPQPVIAKVQGMATAAGCQLVASCDLAVAARDAQFAVSGVRVGLFFSTPAVALSRNVARKRAMEMLLTGDFIDAEAALRYGLINHAVAASALDRASEELARRIASKPRRVIQIGKRRFYQQLDQGLDAAYAGATDTMADNMMLAETIEGIDAFIEKRTPDWS